MSAAVGWEGWSLAPEIVLPLLALAAGYALHVSDGHRIGEPGRTAWMRHMAFLCGFALLAAALVSPLCRLAANLASAHMVQHVILVALAPPLLLFGFGPPVLSRDGGMHLPRGAAVLSWLLRPTRAAVVYGVLIWFWHVPSYYEASATGTSAHLLMYVTLLAASFAFWGSILDTTRSQTDGRAWAIPALLVTLLHTGVLGALLCFSPRPWYPLMAPGSIYSGLTPLEDQQLAGLIMWIPMGAVYLVAALMIAANALSRLENASVTNGSRSASPRVAVSR